MTEPAWVQRFRATSIGFPNCARDVPDHCVYTSNATGVYQVYAWDRRQDTHRRLTDREQGVFMFQISADGEWVWWFDDDGGNEQGRWMRKPFTGGPAEPAVGGVTSGYPIGLRIGRSVTVLGFSTEERTIIYAHRDGEAPSTIYSAPSFARVTALSRNEELAAIDHTEHGDTGYPALRVVDTRTGETVAELSDGPGRGLRALAFAPLDGDARLLVQHERSGPKGVLVWDVRTGLTALPAIDLPGDLSARWYPDGQALLVKQFRHGRDRLFRYDLGSGDLTALETPAGVISAYEIRPSGELEYEYSSSAQPPVVLDGSGRTVLESPDPPRPSVPLTDAWVDGPAGPIHALIARPPSSNGPGPIVIMLHGGPGGWTSDSFWATRAAFVDSGYCVIHVNYRGSSGYGSTWRDADREAPGLIELEDIAAVRDWAVESGIADPSKCVIGGYSWGGYLTLLGLGVQPGLWAAGLANVPIGDLVALYEDEMESVREHDRSLFGGTPDDLPDKWARSSPITYAANVRAPVLVIAGRNDVRCPIRQVENFLAELDKVGAPYEADFFDAGHFSLVVDEQIRQHTLQLNFLSRHVPTP